MQSKDKAGKSANKKVEILDSTTTAVAVVKAESIQEAEVVNENEPLKAADKELLKKLWACFEKTDTELEVFDC